MTIRNKRITQALLLSSVIAVLFDVMRGDNIILQTGFAYLVWNLFLAWLPYIISSCLVKKDLPIRRFIPVFVLWLLFFPNAPYLVTDVLHVESHMTHVLWYDSLLFFFFGLIGLLLGMISLFQMEQYFRIHFKSWKTEIIIFAICAISSFGIYLGRFLRWNSWDLFTHPSDIMKNSYAISTNMNHDTTPFFFITVFTIFMYATYKTFSVLLEKD